MVQPGLPLAEDFEELAAALEVWHFTNGKVCTSHSAPVNIAHIRTCIVGELLSKLLYCVVSLHFIPNAVNFEKLDTIRYVSIVALQSFVDGFCHQLLYLQFSTAVRCHFSRSFTRFFKSFLNGFSISLSALRVQWFLFFSFSRFFSVFQNMDPYWDDVYTNKHTGCRTSDLQR